MNQRNESTTHDDELEPQLESAVWAVLSQPMPPQALQRVKVRALAIGNQPPEQVTLPTRASSKTKSRRLAAALVLAASVLLWLGLAGIFLYNSTPVAFAQAIEQLKAAGAFRYTETLHLVGDKPTVDVRVLVAEDGRQRREIRDIITIQDKDGVPRLTLLKDSKKAIVNVQSLSLARVAAPKGAPPVAEVPTAQAHLKWLEDLKSHADADRDVKSLGEQTLNEHRCVGFAVKVANNVYTVWTDVLTNKLVQVEYEGMPEGSPVLKAVMSNFEFNQNLDDALFSLNVPEGYSQIEMEKAPELLPPEESLVDALKGYTDLSHGKFPASIADWGQWSQFLSESGTSSENSTRISSRLGAILPFLTTMPKDDYEYLGDGKSTHDAKTIVFWYRTADKKLRAIYNDLSTAEISQQDLPPAR